MSENFVSTALALIIGLPLLGAVVNGFLLRKASLMVCAAVGTLAVAVPFALALPLVFGPILSNGQALTLELFDWIHLGTTAGDFRIPFGISVDRLSGTLLLIITGVGKFDSHLCQWLHEP